MDFQKISGFLDKFKDVVFKNENQLNSIKEVIKKHISFDIDKNSVSTKGSIIYIKSSPLVKNEILIHKSGILSDINDLSFPREFKDIL